MAGSKLPPYGRTLDEKAIRAFLEDLGIRLKNVEDRSGDNALDLTGSIILSGDITSYVTTNDGNPQIRFGSSDAEEFHIQAVYSSGTTSLDYMLFSTDTASATANKGKMVFSVDGTTRLSILDTGLDITGDVTLTGNISVGGTVDSRDIATDGTALDVLVASAPIISSGTSAPSSTPSKVGDLYIDTTGVDAYIATGTASSSDWTQIDGGGAGSGDAWSDPVDSNIDMNGYYILFDNNTGISDASGNEIISFIAASSAVNQLLLTNSATGVAVPITAAGGDTNIDLLLYGKNTGNIKIADGTDPTKLISFEVSGATTAKALTLTSSHTDNRTITIPDATDTLVGKATTDNFSNKSISLSTNTLSGTTAEFNTALSDGSFATLAGTEAFSNKTINTASNTITVVEADISDLQSYLLNFVEDTSPQAGATIDMNSYNIQFDDTTGIADDSGNELLMFSKAASAVNYINLANSATGNVVSLSAAGGDTDIGVSIQGKGAGNITLGTYVFDADQTVGAGTDNYILTFDNTSGTIRLEANPGAGGGNSWSDAVDASIVPDTDSTYDLGSGTYYFANAYIDAITTTGNITVGGTVDGRDVAADGTKLDGIETAADVTDEANVVAALDGATLTGVTVAGTDKVIIQDVSDSDNIKTVTAQAIADLGAGGGADVGAIIALNMILR